MRVAGRDTYRRYARRLFSVRGFTGSSRRGRDSDELLLPPLQKLVRRKPFVHADHNVP